MLTGKVRRLLTAVFACAIAGVGNAQTGVTPIPPEVSTAENQWPLPNKDYANTRAVLDGGISSANVDELGIAWWFELPPPPFFFGSAAANPIIAENVVYFQDLGSNVFAISLDDGELQWERRYDVANFGPTGVAVGWGKVFGLTSERTFAALDKETGEEIWSVELSRSRGEGIDIAPVMYDGMVYMSTVPVTIAGAFEGLNGYVPGATGIIYALDQETGEIRWRFDTVDSDDIWGDPIRNSGGGAWYPPSIDIERGLTYWGIGNAAPWPGTEEFPNGSSRPGPNLYTNSLVALDHRTGELEWFNQVRPHDLFDQDFMISPILVTATINGDTRAIAIGAGKSGDVVAFDRDTGETVWRAEVGVHQNDDLTEVPPGEVVEVFPGVFGGVETPMSYADGVVYVPNVNFPARYSSTQAIPMFNFADGTGELTALDVATGRVLWNREFGAMVLGAATVVNDLVFTSTLFGTIYALDRETGEEKWTYQLPGGVNAWPAVAGDTIIFPIGMKFTAQPPMLLALRIGAGNDIVSFIRGDPNDDGKADIADSIWILNELFQDGPDTVCRDSADTNKDSRIDLGDAVFLLQYLLGDGRPPAPQTPGCELIKLPRDSSVDLGCESSTRGCQ